MQTRLVDLVLNLLRKNQYEGTTPNTDELYLVTDDVGITSGDVVNALGYTPYNATNPNGYINNTQVGNGTITLSQDNITQGSFTTNQNTNATINLKGLYDYYVLKGLSIQGIPTVNGAIASDFTESDYVYMTTALTLPTYWEIWIKFTTGTVPSESDDENQYIIGGATATPAFAIYLDDLDEIVIQMGATTASTQFELQSNTTYYLRLIWNLDEDYFSNNGLNCLLYNANKQYINDVVLSGFTAPASVQLWFGATYGANRGLDGSIDFSETYINKINYDALNDEGTAELLWKGVERVIDTKADKSEIGGSSRNIGEIVASTIPLTDAGLHLLDGALLSGSGSYADFVDYIADLYDSGNYTAIFETEANWQAAVTLSGVCGKFVYDSVNDTVRLPKWGNQALSVCSSSTVQTSVFGSGKALGLTNGTDNYGMTTTSYSSTALYEGRSSSAYGVSAGSTGYSTGTALTAGTALGVSTDSTNSGLTGSLNASSILSNYATDCYYYIVVATSTKTQIEVDIDQIATDLNGKADTDLSNVPTSKAILTSSYVNGTSWYRIYSDGWCEQGGLVTVSNGTSGFSVALLQNYINTNYQVIVSPNNSAYGTYGYGANNLTISGFSIYCSNNNNRDVFWRASGYIS